MGLFASRGKIATAKIKLVLNAILPLEQWFFTFLMLLTLKYFDAYQLSLPFLQKQQL